MQFTIMFGVVCALLCASCCLALEKDEPHCSKFSFEERVLEKMVRLEHKMELLTEKMKASEQHIAETMKTSKQELAESQTELNNDKANMVKDLEALQKTLVQEQTTQKETLAQEQTRQKETIDNVLQVQAATLSRMSEDFQSIANKTIQQLEEKTKPSVLYSAREAASLRLTAGSRILFTIVLVNEGDGYDPSTGVFTTPIEGVYIFTAQICTYTKKWVGFYIEANGTVIAASANAEYDTNGSCTTTTAIARLPAGTGVSVKCSAPSSGNALYQYTTYSWNSFSGLLV